MPAVSFAFSGDPMKFLGASNVMTSKADFYFKKVSADISTAANDSYYAIKDMKITPAQLGYVMRQRILRRTAIGYGVMEAYSALNKLFISIENGELVKRRDPSTSFEYYYCRDLYDQACSFNASVIPNERLAYYRDVSGYKKNPSGSVYASGSVYYLYTNHRIAGSITYSPQNNYDIVQGLTIDIDSERMVGNSSGSLVSSGDPVTLISNPFTFYRLKKPIPTTSSPVSDEEIGNALLNDEKALDHVNNAVRTDSDNTENNPIVEQAKNRSQLVPPVNKKKLDPFLLEQIGEPVVYLPNPKFLPDGTPNPNYDPTLDENGKPLPPDKLPSYLPDPNIDPYPDEIGSPNNLPTLPDGSRNPAYKPWLDPYSKPLANPQTNPDGKPNPNYNPNLSPQGRPLTPPQSNPQRLPDGSPNPNYNAAKDPYGNPLPTVKKDGETGGFVLPMFCEWAATVCDLVGYVKSEPNLDKPTVVDVDNTSPTLPSIDEGRFNLGGQCPADFSQSVTVAGHSFDIKFSSVTMCSFLQSIRPFVIGSGYLSAAFIVLGIGRSKS